MTAYTPGPWLPPTPFASRRFEVVGGTHLDTRQVAIANTHADAVLISVAPELLERAHGAIV